MADKKMVELVYPLVINPNEKDENGLICGRFPDLEGLFPQGSSVEEVCLNASEQLVIAYQEKKGKLNAPSAFSEVQKQFEDEIVLIVTADPGRQILRMSRAIKKTLTIPAWLNEIAEKYKINFSGELKKALLQSLKDENLTDYERELVETASEPTE